MYNKLFAKILDSSIWLESVHTRIVWLTMIAAMDKDGFVQFASVENLSYRARVSVAEAKKAVQILESEDDKSSDPDNGGRRIEKVPGGWMILNSEKHRGLVTSAISREQIRVRVARHRENKKDQTTLPVTTDPLRVTNGNDQHDYDYEYAGSLLDGFNGELEFQKLWKLYPRKEKVAEARERFLLQIKTPDDLARITRALEIYRNHVEKSEEPREFIMLGGTWFYRRWPEWVDQCPVHEQRPCAPVRREKGVDYGSLAIGQQDKRGTIGKAELEALYGGKS